MKSISAAWLFFMCHFDRLFFLAVACVTLCTKHRRNMHDNRQITMTGKIRGYILVCNGSNWLLSDQFNSTARSGINQANA